MRVPSVLVSALCLALLVSDCSAFSDCECYCGPNCKSEKKWIQVGRGDFDKYCTCQCHCPPFSSVPGQPNNPPSFQNPFIPPWVWSPSPPQNQQPENPNPPPATQSPDNPSQQPGFAWPPFLNQVEKCQEVAMNFGRCGETFARAFFYPNADLGEACCTAMKELKDCIGFGIDVRSFIPLDFNAHCRHY